MLIAETFVNLDKGYRFGETAPYEPWTQRRGALFHTLQREYGRCTGKVYIDRKDGGSQAIGWVFAKRCQYDDSPEYYTREVWVTVYEKYEQQVSHTVEYADLGGRS